MNRQLALKLVSKMQTNVWNLTDKQAEIILGFLDSDNERSEQLNLEELDKAFDSILKGYDKDKLQDWIDGKV